MPPVGTSPRQASEPRRDLSAAAAALRYRRLFESARDGILLVDPVTRQIVDVNPFLEEFLGYTHAEFLGRELFEIGLLKDEAGNREAFQELLQAGHVRYEDLPLQTKDGRAVAVEFVSNVYEEGGHLIIQCNVRDITARKQTELALGVARQKLARHAAELEVTVLARTAELQRSHAQLETFVYSIAHDLRAPLRSMQGFAQLLVEEQTAGPERPGRDYARSIDAAAQLMDRLLADLLAFSRISQEEMTLRPVELEEVVVAALAACSREIAHAGVQVEKVGPWPAVLAHAPTLCPVLVNLIGNAAKFVAPESPRIRLRAEERPDNFIRVWVEDNGIGIRPEYHARIFQVFQRLHTTAYAGTGIGLAIVQKGMERMNGRVGVESAPGEGSRFWVELARAPHELPATTERKLP